MIYIDVSHYDWDRNKGNLNWALIKSSGIDVVFIRASYGDPTIYSPETRYFKEMATAAKAAGLRVGGYHNLINGDFASIKRQVDYFKSQLDSVNADYAMVDVEPYQALRDNDLWPRLGAAELFAQEFRQVDIRKLAVYIPQWVWSNWLNKADLRSLMEIAKGPLVASNYPLGTTKGMFDELYAKAKGDSGVGWNSYGNVSPKIWQYSSNASVPGASSVTDVNAFRGTLEELDSEMAWVLTRNMQAFRDQMNTYFPDRDKTSDGTIGDAAHAAGTSGHNPDDSQYDNAEWDNDSDNKSEVRAIDIDVNLNYPGVTMEDVLQHLLQLVKKKYVPIRYVIYNRRIFRRNNGWKQETYTGPNPHDKHIHISGDYTDAADENYFDYELGDLVAVTDSDVTKIVNAIRAMDVNPDDNASYSLGGAIWTMFGRTTALNGWNELAATVAAIASKVDLDPAEIQALKDALAVPTAAQNAEAVVAALGSTEISTLAEVLRNGLPAEKVAELKAAL